MWHHTSDFPTRMLTLHFISPRHLHPNGPNPLTTISVSQLTPQHWDRAETMAGMHCLKCIHLLFFYFFSSFTGNKDSLHSGRLIITRQTSSIGKEGHNTAGAWNESSFKPILMQFAFSFLFNFLPHFLHFLWHDGA
ncbi:uncharacterized protein K452DRAFT_118265 [Aplosporella prunicola CBS 121167]|uniref:Uncharacterized protein n=1 Tax=Aplosporella prunicola CBS 121167 TaxID=1176127 RepID=A0A6A6B040_9PEZI|nr:uncharacterized protein K452DRAFT_148203 [Aplosporella prunicola CBS 121167]XP_033392521.1 uncharacterized protein K452DRAFT_118265 [Aplosporella prunicola CBS 121167]KAF2136123.1 hypothetical protein K452DRAFT_148203 [Aplosporella prunicola CBS 121167]KAF2136803.1 hypothetical protein K452DRAFT_118265 [Aplosporella prunicola CBS 121167]